MDLGFGAKNQIIGDVLTKAVANNAVEQEAQIDSDMAKYDELMNDEDALERLRAKRMDAMKAQQRQRLDWQAQGHGRYMELTDTKEFFHAAKTSDRLVVHFCRPTTRMCEVVDAHFEKMCPKHVETRFCKINAEKSDYLVEKVRGEGGRGGGWGGGGEARGGAE